MELEPITRQEKIIAGQDLTPITRMEMFLKNFGGGGGGGSVPKPLTYDYMPEGYPTKTMGTVTVMEEQEVLFTDDKGNPPHFGRPADQFEIVVGKTYIVNWDGTEYECICFEFNTILCLGNLSLAGAGDDTGEPFIYIRRPGDDPRGEFDTLDTSATHIISVKTIAETVTPIAEEFLPSEVNELIMNSSTPGSTKKFIITVDDSGTISATELT